MAVTFQPNVLRPIFRNPSGAMGRKLRDVEMPPDDAAQILLGPNTAVYGEIAMLGVIGPCKPCG